VNDLVTALEAQVMRHAEVGWQVTLAGYTGKYLESSVPAGMQVTGDANFMACELQGDGNRDFVSWEGRGGAMDPERQWSATRGWTQRTQQTRRPPRSRNKTPSSIPSASMPAEPGARAVHWPGWRNDP
jgi:hypothetical protein